MEIVDRPWQSNVQQYADILDAIMRTARSGKAARFDGAHRLPWSIGGLRNILARRGFRLRTCQRYAGSRSVLDVWCEVIVPPTLADPPRRITSARRIRLVEREV